MPTPEQLELIFPDPAEHPSPDRGGTGYDQFAARYIETCSIVQSS